MTTSPQSEPNRVRKDESNFRQPSAIDTHVRVATLLSEKKNSEATEAAREAFQAFNPPSIESSCLQAYALLMRTLTDTQQFDTVSKAESDFANVILDAARTIPDRRLAMETLAAVAEFYSDWSCKNPKLAPTAVGFLKVLISIISPPTSAMEPETRASNLNALNSLLSCCCVLAVSREQNTLKLFAAKGCELLEHSFPDRATLARGLFYAMMTDHQEKAEQLLGEVIADGRNDRVALIAKMERARILADMGTHENIEDLYNEIIKGAAALSSSEDILAQAERRKAWYVFGRDPERGTRLIQENKEKWQHIKLETSVRQFIRNLSE